MKHIINYSVIGILSYIFIITSSCTESNTGFLDPDLSGDLNREMVFSDSIYTHEYQSKIYRDLQVTYFADNGMSGGGLWSWSDLSDDSKQKWSGNAQIAHMYNMNTWNDPNANRLRNHWQTAYANITRANIFLENVDNSPLTARKIEILKAETRFMRAWYYFHLLRLYGGTPIIGDKVYDITEKVEVPRATFAEMVDYIVSECEAVAQILPAEQKDRDYGRATSGAALGVKARVLLFAASPLSNGKIPTSDQTLIPYLGNATADATLWKKAADAAKAVIDLNRYSLVEDNQTAPGYGFYQMQIQRVNTEYIFNCMKRNYKYYEALNLPGSRGGQVYASPFQGLVDAFLTRDGKRINDPTSGYDIDNPYVNRDPRFGYSILHDGSMWIPNTGSSVKQRINFYYGAPTDGLGIGATKTGYAFRKFCNENVTGGSNNNDNVSPFIRLAEMYLNYAEALNEYDPSGSKQLIEDALIKIRKRAGINPGDNNRYGLPTSYTQGEMREIIQNERRIEFALEEGHRFFDLKRWARLEETKKDVDFYGISWSEPDANGKQTWQPFFIEQQKFDPGRQYYFPIPTAEINILGTDLLLQNPGW